MLRQDYVLSICERQEPLPQGARFSKNGFVTIGDTNWQKVDPMQIKEKIPYVEIAILKTDVVFFSGLSIVTSIPFATPFSELCMEVSQHWKKGERVLRDIKGDVIMDFSLEAISVNDKRELRIQ